MAITRNYGNAKRQVRVRRGRLPLLSAVAFLIVVAALFPFAWQAWINWRYQSRLYTVDSVPHHRVAIVFGAHVYRNDRLSVLIYPARVQGKQAAAEIAAGIDYLNTRSDLDVLIVGRGGGSLEDLWPFNEEVVARAIFRSRIPVISAVGHEIDFTIADFVSDLRAPTPSAAAEIVSGQREELASRVRDLQQRGFQGVRYQLQRHRQKLERLTRSRGFVDAETRIRFLQQRLDEARLRLQAGLGPLIQNRSVRVSQARRDLGHQIATLLTAKRHRLGTCSEKLRAYSPLQVLERGYAIVTTQDGEVVRDPAELRSKELLNVRVVNGQFRARKED